MRERPRRSSGHSPASAALVSAAILALAALPLEAQQAAGGAGGPSLAADNVPLHRTIPERESVMGQMDHARLRLGPMRILPSFNVWNAGYDSNVFGTSVDPVGDWTATVNAGATFLIPFGSKIVLKADAFPQYTWYNELSDRDEFGGRYNGSLYGFFNRMTVELQGASFQQYQSYSSEIDSPVFQTSFAATAKFDLELGSRLALFGQGVYQDVTYEQIEGPPVQEGGVPNNDRTGTGIRGGLRYGMSPDWNVGVVAEGTFSDFEFQPEFRNNSSTAILASVEFNRQRFFLNLLGGYREGTNADSIFPRYSTGVGSFFVSYFLISWLEIQGFGHRSVSYSISEFNPYYFENRIGGKLNIQLGNRVLISGHIGVGPNNYPRAEPVDVDGTIEFIKRRDEAEEYGGGISVIVYRPLVFNFRVNQSSYTSNIPRFGRSYTRYMATINFGGTFER